jgi:hypothetical protein
MAALEVKVRCTLGEPETGLWCPDCLLPSVIRVPVLAEAGREVWMFWVSACADCPRQVYPQPGAGGPLSPPP